MSLIVDSALSAVGPPDCRLPPEWDHRVATTQETAEQRVSLRVCSVRVGTILSRWRLVCLWSDGHEGRPRPDQ